MRPLYLDKNIANLTTIRARYHNDIRKSKPMSPNEEYDIFERYRNGDLKAKEIIILSNLRFVVSCAKKYEGCGIPVDDLINEGNIGLITAIDRFDHTKGFKFITYAVSWIRQAILLAISENSRTIYLPANITSKLTKVKDEINKMEVKYGYFNIDEILASENLSKDIIAITEITNTVSTDTPIDDDGEISLGEILTSDDTADSTTTSDYLKTLISLLTRDEADIIKRTFGFPPYIMAQPIEYIAENYKSKSYVSTIYKKAMAKLIKAAKTKVY